MMGMSDQLIALDKVRELTNALQKSSIYTSRLAGIERREEMTLIEIHNILASMGGIKKDEWLSSSNIVSEDFFASDYKGVTSGRSGGRTEYTKSSEWIKQRDLWRQANLRRISGSKYAVVNIGSRLFPHDEFDITVLDSNLKREDENRLGRIIESYKKHELTIIFRGFPARLVESIRLLRRICTKHQIRSIVLTTGWPVTPVQQRLLEENFGRINIFSEYGAQDLGIQLYSCKTCGMYHADNPRSLVTFNNRKIFATDLYSHTQPVIAADTSDLASVRRDACSADPGITFTPVCMPPVFPPLSGQKVTRIINNPNDLQVVLVGPNTHRDIAEASEATMQGPIGQVHTNTAIYKQRLLELVSQNNITGCRSLLEKVLDKKMLMLWRQRNISIVSFLVGILMIVSCDQWIQIAWPWIDYRHASLSAHSRLLKDTSSRCTHLLSRSNLECVALLVIEIIVTLNSLDPHFTFTEALNALEPQLEVLFGKITHTRPIYSCLPLGASIHSYVMAYCWRHHKELLDIVMHAYSGQNTYNIGLIEKYQALGHLKKI